MTPKLHLITAPSLEVRSARRVLHDTLLDEFPAVTDVARHDGQGDDR